MNNLKTILIVMSFFVQNLGLGAHIKLLKHRKNSNKATFKKGDKDNDLLSKMLKQNEEIKLLLKRRSQEPLIWEGESKIQAGAIFSGTLLNSINSTNLASPVLVSVNPNQGLPYKSKLTCFGATAHKRVQVVCNRLVTKDREVSVSAMILNTDGSAGLIGEYDDGKEDLITGVVISNFTNGALSASKDRVASGLGEFEKSNFKNKILSGLISSGESASEIMLEEMKSKEPVVCVDAGVEVMIYFKEGVREY